MKEEKYLPLGTVVILKNATHQIMIIGFGAVLKPEDRKVYDYLGCFYPEGVLKTDEIFAFDHEEIDKIFFEGYNSINEQAYRAHIKKVLKENTDEKGELQVPLSEIAAQNGNK